VIRIIWSPLAIDDVEAIRAYVTRDSADSADLLVERLVAAVERLEVHPCRGVSSRRSATTRLVK
jgi:toxin ParE1/3/4